MAITSRTVTSVARSFPFTSRTFVTSLQRPTTTTASSLASRSSQQLEVLKASSVVQTRRQLSATAVAREPPVDNPSHASVDHDMRHEYPEIHERDEVHGVGHTTIGEGVGRHSERTLASLSMSGKVCLVTGAARGLGNLFARTFVESGCNQLVVVDLNEQHAQKAAEEIVSWFVEHGEAEPGEIDAIGIGCDVANEQQVVDLFHRVKEHYGRVDAVVNSAGICENIPAVDYSSEKLHKLLNINIDGSFFVAREAAKMMMSEGQGGAITLVGSMSGSIVNVPQPQTPYNMSKAAVKHMASSLAVEWAKHGIRVNCLAPGYMETSLTKVILDRNPALRETWENLTPVGKLGQPEDLKGAIVYLNSDSSRFLTGQQLTVDGGYSLT